MVASLSLSEQSQFGPVRAPAKVQADPIAGNSAEQSQFASRCASNPSVSGRANSAKRTQFRHNTIADNNLRHSKRVRDGRDGRVDRGSREGLDLFVQAANYGESKMAKRSQFLCKSVCEISLRFIFTHLSKLTCVNLVVWVKSFSGVSRYTHCQVNQINWINQINIGSTDGGRITSDSRGTTDVPNESEIKTMTLSTTCNAQTTDAYLEPLLAGDRTIARLMIEKLEASMGAYNLLTQLVWPTMERIQELYKDDQITITQLNLATRLNRSITDQLCAKLTRAESNGKKVLIFCGNDEPEELGGQICAELFECEGYSVKFAGGGVPDDEVLKLIGEVRPNLLVMFATRPSGVPAVRQLIDYLREVNSCPEMQIMCCGGIYKRAEGLSEEIGADLYAPDAVDAVKVAAEHPTKRASVEQQTVGRTRRIRKAEARKAGTPAKKDIADAA